MGHNFILDLVLFFGLFLVAIGILQVITKKTSAPYTVALLVAGFISQFVVTLIGANIHITLSTDIIFYILLPALLFEAALHINIHQFRIQFKTITFLATFGLLISIFVVGIGMSYLLGIPLEVALLFGAIISATDPIAVLALFKTLGAPKRLALIADGESMFNDATAVIAFRVISTFAIANTAFRPLTLFESTLNFLYVFLGSIILGGLIGYAASYLFAYLKEERVILSVITTGLAIGSFAAAEHFLHVSGVMTVVIMGLIIGNFGRTKINSKVMHFIEEYWESFGFIALSLVFFFASFNLELDIFGKQIGTLLLTVGIVLLARAISVYLSVFLTNKLTFFKDEPSIPASWQHILNWGGLRGVIPLVLVSTLPDTFAYKDDMLRFTFASLLFTLFVNGLTIKWLLIKLGLHLPRKEEQIIAGEKNLFELEEKRKRLQALSKEEFDATTLLEVGNELKEEERKYKAELLALTTPQEFLQSLKLEAIDIERSALKKLFEQGRFSEAVYHSFDSELDLQQDALEYPDIRTSSNITREGHINTNTTFRKRLINLRRLTLRYRMLSNFLGIREESFVVERYGLLRARLFTSYAVLDYLDRVKKIIMQKNLQNEIAEVRKAQEEYINRNQKEVEEIAQKYPQIVLDYQRNMINYLIDR